VKNRRGFTLLEMIVATTILGVAVTGLLAGLAGVTRNATRLREYDRAVQLARLRMNDLLADTKAPHRVPLEGMFDPQLTGGIECGWRAVVAVNEISPLMLDNDLTLDRVQLEVWWMAGGQRRALQLEGYRRRPMVPEDMAEAAPK
jgi:general secretion pathway protein I